MRLELPEKVLEKLATSDRITLVIDRQPDGKMRVMSGSWDGDKLLLRDQVLEVCCRQVPALSCVCTARPRRMGLPTTPTDPHLRAPQRMKLSEVMDY